MILLAVADSIVPVVSLGAVEQEAAHPLVRSVDPFLGAGGGRGVATEADNEQSSKQLQHFG